MSALEKPVYRFQSFKLEPSERRLSDGDRSIPLTPKVFDTLVLLVERAGQVVSKDELMKALWPRGFVDDSNLTKHIWFIRRALGDREQDSHFIETVPKVGYRFAAPVIVSAAPPRAPTTAAPDLPADVPFSSVDPIARRARLPEKSVGHHPANAAIPDRRNCSPAVVEDGGRRPGLHPGLHVSATEV